MTNERKSLLLKRTQKGKHTRRLFDSTKKNWDENSDKALQFANQAIAFSQKQQYSSGITTIYVLLGGLYANDGDFPKSLSYLQKAADIAKKENNTREQGAILYNMSTTYYDQSAYDKSFEAGIAALNIKKELKDTIGIAKCYRLLAEVYSYKHDYEKAESFIADGITLLRGQKVPLSLARMLTSAGNINIEAGKYTAALKFLKEAETYIDSTGGDVIAQSVYNNIGRCYDRMGNTGEAERYYLLALNAPDTGNRLAEVILTNNLGQIYLTRGKNELAEKYLYKALAMAKEINSVEDIANIHSNLADLYISKKDFRKAYEHKDLYIAYADSVMNQEKMKAIEELSVKFETKEIAYKNKQLEQKVNEQKFTIIKNLFWVYGSLSVAVIIILIAVFYTRNSRLKINMQRMELEQQQYRAQMNPHFIFNCMNSIQHYIVHNDVKSANKFLSQFAGLMRRTLDINAGHFISVQEEMNYLENYLQLEQMRFDGKFSYSLVCSDDIGRQQITLPTMMLQPFAENAIQHGLRYLPDNSGLLSISFKKENDFLLCEIDDNGIGREAARIFKKQSGTTHLSQGILLIENKLAVLNNIYKAQAYISVVDKTGTDDKATGTTVILKFPLQWK
jgi:tetratricopeptide (TPR) repeat protein